MKAGDVVLYAVAGQTHNALVLHVHSGQPEHLGKNGEPLLHLAFLAPERESVIERKKFGYIPQVFTEFDVVHYSQEFSADYKKANGLLTPAQIAQQRGQGEWREVPEADEQLVEQNARLQEMLSVGQVVLPESPIFDPEDIPEAVVVQPALAIPFAAPAIFGEAPPAPPLHEAPVKAPNKPHGGKHHKAKASAQVPEPNPTQE